jgi:hypothetical protein
MFPLVERSDISIVTMVSHGLRSGCTLTYVLFAGYKFSLLYCTLSMLLLTNDGTTSAYKPAGRLLTWGFAKINLVLVLPIEKG